MNKPLLSVCIPTYNRAELLRVALMSVLPQTIEQEGMVEVIVSDNCSSDHTKEIVAWASQYGPIRYYINNENIGATRNFFKLTDELAQGEFCWLVGDDDFVMPEAIKEIVAIIKAYKDIDYIFAVESDIDTGVVLNRVKQNLHTSSKDFLYLAKQNNNSKEIILTKVENLINPDIHYYYLDFISNSVFRTATWRSVDKRKISGTCFSDWKSTYPHVYVLGNGFFGKEAYYSGSILIISGHGSRDWSGNNFCSGYLPVIYLQYFDDILNFYHRHGLKDKLYKNCCKAQATIVGEHIYDYFYYRYVKKMNIPGVEQIKYSSLYKYFIYCNFWKQILPRVRVELIRFFSNKMHQ